jgi:hypothetical protein
MNNKIKLAVAGAVLSAASVANAGIIIPAVIGQLILTVTLMHLQSSVIMRKKNQAQQ